MIKTWRLFSILILLVFLILSDSASAIERTRNNTLFGIKAGYYSDGTITIDDEDYSAESGNCFGIFFDQPISRNYLAGLAFDFNKITAGFMYKRDSEILLNLSLMLKRDFRSQSRRISLRPGFGLGYAILDKFLILDNSNYFTIRIQNEIIFHTRKHIDFLGEIGFFWAPAGGDGDYDVHSGPFLFIRGGLIFK